MLGLSIPFALLHRLGLLCPYTGRICCSLDIDIFVLVNGNGQTRVEFKL